MLLEPLGADERVNTRKGGRRVIRFRRVGAAGLNCERSDEY